MTSQYEGVKWPPCVFGTHFPGYTELGISRGCKNERAKEYWDPSRDYASGGGKRLFSDEQWEAMRKDTYLRDMIENAEREIREHRETLPKDDREFNIEGGVVRWESCEKCQYRMADNHLFL